MAVLPEYQHNGVTTGLFEVERAAPARARIQAGLLRVRSANEGAQRLYERLGYHEIEQMPDHFGPGHDGLRMVRTCAVTSSGLLSVRRRAFPLAVALALVALVGLLTDTVAAANVLAIAGRAPCPSSSRQWHSSWGCRHCCSSRRSMDDPG
jgi:ribosomal protein S18 acetylase RimI-like enzyme